MIFICDNQRHLICSIENLHKMAQELNIKKCWFDVSHYDIPKLRIEEIKEKCISVRPRDMLKIIKENETPKTV